MAPRLMWMLAISGAIAAGYMTLAIALGLLAYGFFGGGGGAL